MSSPISPGGRGTGTNGSSASVKDAGVANLTVTQRSWLPAYWRSATGLTILAATVLGFAIRMFMLTRHGFLTGVTEYDDGVYLGGSIRLLEGSLPYHNYAFVQPPGMVVLMLPVALFAKITTTTAAMALARILTVLASTACITLAGNLVRYRGVLVTIVTCGTLAVYPDDITTAHTLLLEPWMNLLAMLAVTAAFRRGRLASPRRLAWAGLALGVAASVKFWAAVPALVLLVVCLLIKDRRVQRTRSYVLSLAGGFLLPVLPFVLASSPMIFLRSTLFDQATRAGSYVPLSLRLAHITGFIDVINTRGRFTLHPGQHSLFASASTATTGSVSAGWLPAGLAVILFAAVLVGYSWEPRRPSQLEWFALATALIAASAIVIYSAFFYHYPSFVAPWMALALGGAVGCLTGRQHFRRLIMGCAAGFVVAVAVVQVSQLASLSVTTTSPFTQYIPNGSCVVSDEVSMLIAADRFDSSSPGCPDIIDSLATTLVLSNGVSNQGGAQNLPKVVNAWQSLLAKAQYVLLSPTNSRRIPWSDGSSLLTWFYAHYQAITPYIDGQGQLYQRDSS